MGFSALIDFYVMCGLLIQFLLRFLLDLVFIYAYHLLKFILMYVLFLHFAHHTFQSKIFFLLLEISNLGRYAWLSCHLNQVAH